MVVVSNKTRGTKNFQEREQKAGKEQPNNQTNEDVKVSCGFFQ